MRHALWGYRAKATDVYISDLEARAAERQERRTALLNELKGTLQEAQQDVDAAQAELQSLQAEYFRLSGEIDALSVRANQMLQDSHQQWLTVEEKAQEAVVARRDYTDSLADYIRQVPQEIRSIIENISRAIAQAPSVMPGSDREPVVDLNPPGEAHG